MKSFLYPAVLYKDKDEEGYTIALHDLGIVTDGKTVEDAFKSAQEYLWAMVTCAEKFECLIEAPSTFEKVASENKNNLVILVYAAVWDD